MLKIHKFLFFGLVPAFLLSLSSCTHVLAVDPFSLVIMPDSQGYPLISQGADIYKSQIDWLLSAYQNLQIKYVLHVGDITNNNSEAHWTMFKNAITRLDSKIPYALAIGNHDYDPHGTPATIRTTSKLNSYFPISGWAGTNLRGTQTAGKLDNAFFTFTAGGNQWLILTLEWAPRQAVVDWANQVLKSHRDHRAIIVTHAFLNYDGRISDPAMTYDPHWISAGRTTPNYHDAFGSDMNNGTELWNELIKNNPNVVMVFNGHYILPNDWNTGNFAILDNAKGEKVFAQFFNFQAKFGTYGDGYFRVLSLEPDSGRVNVKTYSPYKNQYLSDPKDQFTVTGLRLQNDMPGDFNGDGLVNLIDFNLYARNKSAYTSTDITNLKANYWK